MLALYSSEMTAVTENCLLGSVQLYRSFFSVISSYAYDSLLAEKIQTVRSFLSFPICMVVFGKDLLGPLGHN